MRYSKASQNQAGHQNQKGPMVSHPRPPFKAHFINHQTAIASPLLLLQVAGRNNHTHGSGKWDLSAASDLWQATSSRHMSWWHQGSRRSNSKMYHLHIYCLFNKPILGESFFLINTSFLFNQFLKAKWVQWENEKATDGPELFTQPSIMPFLKLTASYIPLRPPIRRHQIS